MPMHDLNCSHPKPHFSRMHYQMVADALEIDRPSSSWTSDYILGYNAAIATISGMFAMDNHLFDRGRFTAATQGYRKGYR
jgi:hypothetical protein